MVLDDKREHSASSKVTKTHSTIETGLTLIIAISKKELLKIQARLRVFWEKSKDNALNAYLKTNATELLDDHRGVEPPDPIPNSEVKSAIADGSVGDPMWE